MSNLKFPIDFYEYISTQGNFSLLHEFFPEIFKVTYLKEIIEIAYVASTQTDEGRSICFNLAYYSDDYKSKLSNELISSFQEWFFTKPREFSVQELRRLAVCNFPNSALILKEDKKLKRLVISGFIDLGAEWKDSIDAFSNEYLFYFFPLIIHVNSPANIDIYIGTQLLGGLKNGKIKSPYVTFSKDLSPIKKLCYSAIELFKSSFFPLQNHIEQKQFGIDVGIYYNIVSTVLNGIINKHHGGSLIFFDHLEKEKILKHLKVKYCFQEKKALAESYIRVVNSTRKHSGESLDEIKKENQDLVQYCKFIAGLSSVDGAILMSNILQVEGFSTEIRASKKQKKVYVINNDDLLNTELSEVLDVEQFGMRHRAAFNLCSSIDGVLVFVVSQDGGASLVWSENGVVKIKKDLKISNYFSSIF